ncbi:hypothetical protein HRH59_14355 [Rheinheimera sp. YQF-2]|uniref:Uncharacterized protein n=1 Tax=Rheinheimera lutimaris TaxID=2740584 RepID=A0A7Y5ASI0_9GAMM|nr:hypothetical protein [Rheinheimera lutimaris]NRQ43732.1 hypothetical protein [Rheinheimera lutimaris]
MKYFLAACVVITALPLNAGAAIPLEQALELCRAEQNALHRLTCYDAITATEAAVPTASSAKPAAPDTPATAAHVAAVADAPTTAEADFGIEHRKTVEGAAEQIYLLVKSVQYSPRKELIVEFDNGQVWRQNGTDYYKIAAGEQHYVKRGVLNSFFLGNDNNNRTIRVRREK